MTPLNKSDHEMMILWGASAIEALVALTWLLLIPSDPKNVILCGYSIMRLMIAACLILGFIGCIGYLITIWRGSNRYDVLRPHSRFQIPTGYIFFALLFIITLCVFLILLPPSILRGAPIERLFPLLAWIGICSAQIAVVIYINAKQEVLATSEILFSRLNKAEAGWQIGIVLLLLSFVYGLITVNFTYYTPVDEGDTFLNGWLLSTGKTLYRDTFSHHFPFPYYWVGMITAIFGSSITVYRISLLTLRIIMFGIAMTITRDKFSIGLTSLGWSIIGPLFLGNMLMYYSFDCIFLISIFFIVKSLLTREVKYSYQKGFVIGALIGLALLTDPLMVIPAMIALLFISISSLHIEGNKKEKILLIISPYLSILVVLLIWGGYLIATSSLNEFIQQGIIFNMSIYSKYSGITPSLFPFLKSISNGLGIFSPTIRTITDPYYKWGYFGAIDIWLFAALFFRLAIYAFIVLLLIKKKFSAAVFMFLFGSALYPQGSYPFHGSSFVLLSIAAAAFVTAEFLLACFDFWRHQNANGSIIMRVTAVLTITILITTMFFWLNLRVTEFWIGKRSELSYQVQFSHWINDASHYRSFSCGNDGSTLLFYGNPIIAYLTGLSPASRYSFMTPWVAEVGLQEIITSIDDKLVIAYIDIDGYLSGYGNSEYLSELIRYLDRNYIKKGENLYISPEQYLYCEMVNDR